MNIYRYKMIFFFYVMNVETIYFNCFIFSHLFLWRILVTCFFIFIFHLLPFRLVLRSTPCYGHFCQDVLHATYGILASFLQSTIFQILGLLSPQSFSQSVQILGSFRLLSAMPMSCVEPFKAEGCWRIRATQSERSIPWISLVLIV